MPNFIILSTLAFLTQGNSDGKMDAAQFARVLSGLHAPIRDVEFICEGEYRLVSRQSPDWEEYAKVRDLIVQSNYAYRSDGRAILDLYEKLISDNSVMSHRTFSLGGNLLDTRVLAGSVKPITDVPSKSGGSTGSIDHKNGSPGRFNFLLFWNRHLAKYPDLPGYRCDGWEKINGHDCLKVTIEGMPMAPGAEKLVFWMDMSRGGHALQQEMYNEGKLWYRKHDIELDQFKLPDGSPIWFPVRGQYDTHTSIKGPSTTPVFHEVDAIVQGTLVFNQGLPDERFSVDWHGQTASSPGYQGFADSFKGIPKKDATPRLRRDPAGVEAHQKEKLAEGERQSAALDASASSQRSWLGLTTVQALLTGLGILALGLSYVMMKRSRG